MMEIISVAVGGALQIFLNKIIVWFDAVTLKKHPVIEIVQSPSFSNELLLIFVDYI